MSDTPMPDQQAQDVTNPKKRPAQRRRMSGGRWLWLLFLLLVIGIGVQQLVAVKFWETLDNEAGQIATVDGRLTALEAAMAEQGRLRNDIEQMQQALRQERSLLAIDRIEQQLDAGWQIWVGTGDPKVLVAALHSAQRALAQEPAAAAQALRLAVSRDLVMLKSQQVVDLRAAVESIDTVIASIDQLPLVQDRRVPQDAAVENSAKDEAPASTLLERGRQIASALLQDLWQAIRGMIRVQRLDRAEAGLVAPEQKVFLQQGLRLLLLDARHALIMRNPDVYQQTLTQASTWIQKYTDSANGLVKQDLATLQGLATLNIDPAVMSLEDTRQALAVARAAITGEPMPVAESEPAPAPPLAAGDKASEPAKDVTKGASQ